MTRVGFIFSTNHLGWVGGINYLTNLFHAVAQVKNSSIELVLIVPPSMPKSILSQFPPNNIIFSSFVDRKNIHWKLLRKLSKYALGRDIFAEFFLKTHNVHVLSHSWLLGKNSDIPVITWIPDFQHRRIPDFFSKKELRHRNKYMLETFKESDVILLSSLDAQKDLINFRAEMGSRSKVINFVSGFSGKEIKFLDAKTIQARYKINEKYFYLPAQFWRHKNHKVVIDALELVAKKNKNILVVCTGNTFDYRWPKYYYELMEYASEKKILNMFCILGIIPYDDILSLMKNSIAVINPSKFEGWSTTVEEAKSMGKQVILSDIPVHREQNPINGYYFSPDDPNTLAKILLSLFEIDPVYDPRTDSDATDNLNARYLEFGRKYESLVNELVLSYKKS